MAFGAVTVHELRYLLAYDGDGARLLEHDGHPYLAALSPLVALVLVYLLNRSLRDRRSSWLWLSGGLLGVYGAQALMEGDLAPGRLTGIDSLVGHGGWVALPLAAAAAWLAVRAVRILRQPGPAGLVSARPPAGGVVPSARSRAHAAQ